MNSLLPFTSSCFSVGYTQPLRRCVRCMWGCVLSSKVTEASQGMAVARRSKNARAAAAATESGGTRGSTQLGWAMSHVQAAARVYCCCCVAAGYYPNGPCSRPRPPAQTMSRGRRRPAAAAAAVLGRRGGARRAKRPRRAALQRSAPCAGAGAGPALGLPPRSFSRRGACWAPTGPPAQSSPPARARLHRDLCQRGGDVSACVQCVPEPARAHSSQCL